MLFGMRRVTRWTAPAAQRPSASEPVTRAPFCAPAAQRSRAGMAVVLGACAIALCALACHGSAGAKQEATVAEPVVRFETSRGTWAVKVEVARTDDERSRGLMFRKELAADGGMLFLFEVPEEHGFWMHNTFIPLDMIFLGEDRSVVGVVANAEPHTDILRSVHKPSKYVLEVKGGEAAAHGVGPGTRAVFLDVRE
jgi:uncharacterized protein